MTEPVIGLARYSAEQWALLKTVAEDSDELNDSYEDWLAQRDEVVREFAQHGQRLLLVEMESTG